MEPLRDVVTELKRDIVREPERDFVKEPQRAIVREPQRDVVSEQQTDIVRESQRVVVREPQWDVLKEPKMERPMEIRTETPRGKPREIQILESAERKMKVLQTQRILCSCNLQYHMDMDGTRRQIRRCPRSNHPYPTHKLPCCNRHHCTCHLPIILDI